MSADVNNQLPCQCELCQPNWHMGSGGDGFFEQRPAAPVQQPEAALEEAHFRKLAQALRADAPVLATG